MKRILMILLVLIMGVSLTGCVKGAPNIVVTSYPIEYLVKRLAGDRVNVYRLDNDSSIVQRAQINPEYETILEQADVVFIINELQPYYELYRDDIYQTEVIDLAALSTLYKFERYSKVDVNGEIQYVTSPYYEKALLEDVNIYNQLDPMLWMEPLGMVSMSSTIKSWLVDHYPQEKQLFEDNFAELEIELTSIQARFQELNFAENDIKFASMTPSYGNWQKSFGISVYPVVMSKYGVLPNEELFSGIRARMEADNVGYIVKNSELPEDYQKVYDRLRIELDLQEIELHDLFSLSQEDKDNGLDYMTKMYQNLQTLEELSQ